MAKQIEITLRKEGSGDIVVKCPEKIKLSIPGALLAIKFGLPPADIKPVQWKDVAIAYIIFFAMFLSCAIVTVSIPVCVIFLAASIFLNIYYNQNYFFNFIKKKLAEGYAVEGEEQTQALKAAGLLSEATATSSSAINSTPTKTEDATNQEDVATKIEKLATLIEKGLLTKEEFDAQKAKLLG